MRILQVRFQNLNSLMGQWQIDFTNPAYVSEGIFAITGPTGSGKTTILDAISLALYGRTPRLNKVTASTNEILSRQAGECFAEVTFETSAGRFRCHWSQRKAYRKPSGELQAPKHELSNADTGKVLDSSLRGVAEQIEILTGMDFDRFTRSMLLAQGGFAAFLQAAPDERAPILEQITGTEIYSRISMKVHELRTEQQRRLEVLEAELKGIRLLSPDEEEGLRRQRELLKVQEGESGTKISVTQQAITWLDGMAALEKDLLELEARKGEWAGRRVGFQPEQDRLERANRALELSGDHASLVALRSQQRADLDALEACRTSLPRAEEAVSLADGTLKAAQSLLEQRKQDAVAAAPVLVEVRGLDVKVKERETTVREATHAVQQTEASLKKLQGDQTADLATQEMARKTLESLVRQLDETASDAALESDLAGVLQRMDEAKRVHARWAGKSGEVSAAEKLVRDAEGEHQRRAQVLEKARQGLVEAKEAVDRHTEGLGNVLEHRPLPDWLAAVTSLTERKVRIEKASEAVVRQVGAKKQIEDTGKRHDEGTREQGLLSQKVLADEEKLSLLESNVVHIENEWALLQRIQDMEAARGQLRDGEACPLCGAPEHPFARGNVPAPDATRLQLETAREQRKNHGTELARERDQLVRLTKDIEQMEAARRELQRVVADCGEMIRDADLGLSPDGTDRELDEALTALREDNRTKLEQTNRVVHEAHRLDQELVGLREHQDKAREAVSTAEGALQAQAHSRESATAGLAALLKVVQELAAQREELLGQLKQALFSYGVDSVTLEELDPWAKQLDSRRTQWGKRLKEKLALEGTLSQTEVGIRHRQQQLSETGEHLAVQQERLKTLHAEWTALVARRREMFGEKGPDEEERRLQQGMQEAGDSVETARRFLERATVEWTTLRARLDGLAQSTGNRGRELLSLQEKLNVRLVELGFADETAYVDACLPEGQRKELTERARALMEEGTALVARQQEKVGALEELRARRVTESSREELAQVLGEQTAELARIQQGLGSVGQALTDNDLRQEQYREQLEGIQGQQRECSRWDRLHELIGSADGKKFRNFAQGLTFEIMVAFANQQLQKMTDRYLLVHDGKAPLVLNVVDGYQAGEVRSTKNLSGGESFLVSLALALGLSQMASKKVRVDSLFLDEGFGTLDDEALDTALDTLAGLQQDGKLIGVISHVAGLKERIRTQVQVIPLTGGRSVLSGPGCRSAGAPVTPHEP